MRPCCPKPVWYAIFRPGGNVYHPWHTVCSSCHTSTEQKRVPNRGASFFPWQTNTFYRAQVGPPKLTGHYETVLDSSHHVGTCFVHTDDA